MSLFINKYMLQHTFLHRQLRVQQSDNQEHSNKNGLTKGNSRRRNCKNETHRSIHSLMKSVLQYRMLPGAKKKIKYQKWSEKNCSHLLPSFPLGFL
jgi:hypothetical protein